MPPLHDFPSRAMIWMIACISHPLWMGPHQQLLGDDARELLDTAGCAGTDIFWSNEPVEPVEAVMRAAGL